jgi:hypothetical protein
MDAKMEAQTRKRERNRTTLNVAIVMEEEDRRMDGKQTFE